MMSNGYCEVNSLKGVQAATNHESCDMLVGVTWS